MPPTPKPEGRRRQRDPQCRSAQEEAEPLNDPKQAHLVAAGSGRVGRVRAEWGWGGVGHALGFNSITLRLGPGAAWGRFGPTGAEQSQVGPSRAG